MQHPLDQLNDANLPHQRRQAHAAAKNESPLVVGVGEQEYFVASDIPAFLPYTRKVVFMDDHEIAILKDGDIEYLTLDLDQVEKRTETIGWSPVMAVTSLSNTIWIMLDL